MIHALGKTASSISLSQYALSRITSVVKYGPPMVGSTCVCPSSFGLGVGPSCLLGRPGGEPFEHGTTGVFVGTSSILQWRCSLTL
jgi:hypothetical protein